MRSGLKLVGMIGKTMIATLGENHAEGFSIHVNYCNKESLHHSLRLMMTLCILMLMFGEDTYLITQNYY